MTKTKLIVLIGLAAVATMTGLLISNQEVLANHDAVTQYTVNSSCEGANGVMEHWDKVIFQSDRFLLLKNDNVTIGRVAPGQTADWKFLQRDPGSITNLDVITAEHLNVMGWTTGGGGLIKPKHLNIIDVEYSNFCVPQLP